MDLILQRTAPYLSIISSVPFLSLLILHYGNLWGLYFLITAAPKFLNTVLGFNLAHAGVLAALPYLARTTFGFIFGSIGDLIRRKNLIRLTSIRKLFTIPCEYNEMIVFLGDNFGEKYEITVPLAINQLHCVHLPLSHS